MSVTRRNFPQNSARDGGTSGRQTGKDSPLPAPDNVHPITEARRIEPPARIAPEVLEEFGISRVTQLSGHVEDARRELLEGMRLVDRAEERDLHVWVGQLINSIDDLRTHMATRDRGDAA